MEDANVRMYAEQNRLVAHARGKPEAFTAEENRALRAILRGQYESLRKQGKVKNQTQMGVLIGVGQQTAGKLLGTGASGFSRPTALKLAQLCGFDSPETMLRELGAQADPSKAPQGWATRDHAVSLARSIGYDEGAIERVVAKYTEDRYRGLPARWWMDRIVHEQSEQDAERTAAAAAPPSTPAPPASEPAVTKRTTKRRAG